jgi:hypothetical protein
MTIVLQLLLISAAVGACSMTISKGKVFAQAREWLLERAPFLGELVSCPYCTSHWLALFVVVCYHPQLIPNSILNFLVLVFTIVMGASVSAAVVYHSYSGMGSSEE